MFVRLLAAASLAFLAACSTSSAAILYGDSADMPPGAVMYLDIQESTGTEPGDPPLYGPPEVTGNDLDFDPSSFVATSTGGPLDITDGQLNFTMMAAPGAGFDSILVSEGGDFSFDGFGGAGTTVAAKVSVSVTILDVDGVRLPSPITVFESADFTADMGTAGGSGPLLPWSIDLLAEFGPFLNPGYEYGVTKAEFAINNQLTTNSEADSLAFIAKKNFTVFPGGNLDPNSIPEPASIATLLVGAVFARRRS